MFQYIISAPNGTNAKVSARSKAAALRKGRIALRVGNDIDLRAKFSLNLNLRFGQLPVMDQIDLMSTYSRLLMSKTALESAYERLGERVLPRRPGELASQAFGRSGFHPVACAILAGSEIAGQSGQGADRASDWLADRERRNEQFVGPAKRQVFMSLGLLAVVFALPILTNGMFGQIPSDYVTIQHTPLSRFLMDMYENVYEPINAYVALILILGTLGGTGYLIVKTENPCANACR